MIIDCISDLHGHYPKLEGGDLLIIAGDLIRDNDPASLIEFKDWQWKAASKYKKIIFIAGNHDNLLEKRIMMGPQISWNGKTIAYLEDSGTDFQHTCADERDILTGRNYKIWGSPWTRRFPGMNPHCMAFTCETEEELAEKWLTCPFDTDIMITHSPIYGTLDRILTGSVGSKSLKNMVKKIKPSILICGHIHECGGCIEKFEDTIIINASHVNERYHPINKPIRILYEKGEWKTI